MLQMMNCEALVEFRLNTPQAETEGVLVRKGQAFQYDGYKAVVDTPEGIMQAIPAPRLSATVNEWYQEMGPAEEAPAVIAPASAKESAPQTSSVLEEFAKTRQDEGRVASSDKNTEESQPGGDGPAQDLNKMVVDYEKQTSKGTVIIDDDASIVAKTTKVDGAEDGNTPSVQTKTAAEPKRAVVSQEERSVKETNYKKTVEGSDPKPKRKKPEIISDGEGVIVAKTSVPAINKNEVKQRTSETRSKTGTFRESEEVSETDYSDEGKGTTVGSTTQSSTTSTKAARTGKTAVAKAAENKASRQKAAGVVSVDDQESVVVGKVRPTNEVKDTSDGIHIESSVGSGGEMEEPVATTSASHDGIIMADEATVGSGIDRGNDDVDISDILGDV